MVIKLDAIKIFTQKRMPMSAVANLLDHWLYAFSALTLLVG